MRFQCASRRREGTFFSKLAMWDPLRYTDKRATYLVLLYDSMFHTMQSITCGQFSSDVGFWPWFIDPVALLFVALTLISLPAVSTMAVIAYQSDADILLILFEICESSRAQHLCLDTVKISRLGVPTSFWRLMIRRPMWKETVVLQICSYLKQISIWTEPLCFCLVYITAVLVASCLTAFISLQGDKEIWFAVLLQSQIFRPLGRKAFQYSPHDKAVLYRARDGMCFTWLFCLAARYTRMLKVKHGSSDIKDALQSISRVRRRSWCKTVSFVNSLVVVLQGCKSFTFCSAQFSRKQLGRNSHNIYCYFSRPYWKVQHTVLGRHECVCACCWFCCWSVFRVIWKSILLDCDKLVSAFRL